MSEDTNLPGAPETKAIELRVFVFLVVFLAPILSVAFVGGFGFLIWMSQLLFGPPGPPSI